MVKGISVGMTQSQIEGLFAFPDRIEVDPAKDYIRTSEGESYLVRWYRINFDIKRPTPFVYCSGRLVGFGEDFLKDFSAKNGYAVDQEKRGSRIISILLDPKSLEEKRQEALFKDIEKYDSYLATRLRSLKGDGDTHIQSLEEWVAKFERWNREVEGYNREQSALLKSLTTQQLETYAKYEDVVRGKKTAYKELYLRNLSSSLSADQMAKLAMLRDLELELEGRRTKLEQEGKCLDSERERILQEYADISNYTRKQKAAIQAALGGTQISGFQVMANEMNEVAEGIRRRSEQQQQAFQMRHMNNSLQDISRAIRGY